LPPVGGSYSDFRQQSFIAASGRIMTRCGTFVKKHSAARQNPGICADSSDMV
jgi:hypothetical protein